MPSATWPFEVGENPMTRSHTNATTLRALYTPNDRSTTLTAESCADRDHGEIAYTIVAPHVPELFCPFEGGHNPHAERSQRCSIEWATRHGLLHTESQRRKLERSSVAWLEAAVFHDASPDVLQLASDWTTLFCLLDDHVEAQRLGPLELSAYLKRLQRVMVDGSSTRPRGVVGAFDDLRTRMAVLGGGVWTERFTQLLGELFVAYLWEETNRWASMRPDVETYRRMRTITIGLRLQFLFGELSGARLPEVAAVREAMRPLEDATSRAVAWANDLFTYEKEQRHGELHNLVLIMMHHMGLSAEGAVQHAANMHDDEVRRLLELEATLREPVRSQSRGYVAMLKAWVRGHLDWATQTGRYRQRGTRSEHPDPLT